MKKILVLILALTMMISANALIVPQLGVTLLNQDPDPVSPGTFVDLRFKIQNDGEVAADNVIAELLPEFPFYLDPKQDPVINIGVLPPTGDGKQVYIAKYRVGVVTDAIHGDNEIKLRYKLGSTQWITQSFDIDIETRDPTITIDSVTTTPARIKPGEEATLDVDIKNSADSSIRDVTLKLDFSLSTLLSSTSDPLAAFVQLPFAPVGSATEQKIRVLDPGETKTISYRIIVDSDAESRVYKIPVQLTFYDEQDTLTTKQDLIGVIVGSVPDISVVLDSSELTTNKQVGDVTVRIINKGFSDVKFMDVMLEKTDDFDILTADEVYLGNVDSDDYETAEFTLFLKGNSKEERKIVLPLILKYKDAIGDDYSKNVDIELRLYSPEKLGTSQGSPLASLLILAVVVIGGWFGYKKFRKRKK